MTPERLMYSASGCFEIPLYVDEGESIAEIYGAMGEYGYFDEKGFIKPLKRRSFKELIDEAGISSTGSHV